MPEDSQKDIIREMAEKHLGHQIPDEQWTSETRYNWKQLLHSELYGINKPMVWPIRTKEIK
jgi:hypothetical protein